MGKSHKNRKRRKTVPPEGVECIPKPPSSSAAAGMNNPLYNEQQTFLNPLSKKERNDLFSPAFHPERRGELWMDQATLGEQLVNKYSWATPDDRCMRILKHYSPIVEIGCGANAYWSQCMAKAGIDILAYDVNPQSGGTIRNGKQMKKQRHAQPQQASLNVQTGGPEVLQRKGNRALFLCYPDEDGGVTVGDSEEMSMGSACLEYYTGDIVIHVGELYSDTLSVDQAPWGRSSGPDFQVRLASEFHCILKASLSNWLHVRDTISVWKRTQTCPIVFAADSDDEHGEDEEVEYRYIPESERLPVDIAAPCLVHLLNDKHPANGSSSHASTSKKPAVDADITNGDKSNALKFKGNEKNKKRGRPRQEGNGDTKDDEYKCPW